MFLDITESELQEIHEEIVVILGGATVDVDIEKAELLILLKRSMNEFQKETSIWQLKNQFGNIYGQAAGVLQQQSIATMNFALVQQVSDWFASMARVGGKIPWHKDYILLEPGRQIYDLSKESSKPYPTGTRRIHRIMWVAKPDMFNGGQYTPANPSGDDVLYSNNWNFNANGLAYGGSRLGMLGSSFDTIMMMQSQELRNSVVFSEFFHNLSGDILEITPTPGAALAGVESGMKLFYYYWEESEVVLGRKDETIDYDGEVNSITGYHSLPPGEANMIANPIDMKIDYVAYSSLSPWAKSWIFDYTLARCKYVQGSKWRKIQKTMTGGDNEFGIEFDYASLLSESAQEIEALQAKLREDLAALDVVKMYEDKASIAESSSQVTRRIPKLWVFM